MDQFKSILAKYWVAILCGIIALAAIVVSFVPLGGYHEELHTKMRASAGNYDKAKALETKPRLQPIIPGQTTPDPLKWFPSDSVIKSGQDLRDKLNTQSLDAVKTVVEINRKPHQELLPGLLPNPQGVGPINYREAYIARLGPNGTLYTQVLKAGLPPTAEEIAAEEKRIWDTEFKPQLVPDPSNVGKFMNEDPVNAQFLTRKSALPQQMKESRAHAFKVYAAADAIPIDPVVANRQGGLPPDPRKIWWSQLQLWVEEDVAHAIEDANAPAPDVTGAAIKRLIKLDLPPAEPSLLFTGRGGPVMMGGAGPGVPPVPVDPNAPAPTPDTNTPVPHEMKMSPSGRVSCGMYDVVQFHLELVVGIKDLPWVLQCIAKNRMMSVLNVDSIVSEDSVAAENAGFIYGTNQVVRVRLTCESLFLREWTLPLMPPSIQRILPTNAAAAPVQ